jgi:hypothetical protein
MKKIKIILFIVVITFIVCLYFLFGTEKKCRGNEFFKNISFQGVVSKKYLDPTQHLIPVIDLVELQSNKINTIDFFLDISNSYDKIEISDTILKKEGSMDIYIIKNNNAVFLTKVDFSCQW